MSTETKTFEVHPTRVAELHDRISRLSKQAAKVGAFIAFATEERDEVDDDGAVTVWTDVTVTFEPLRLPGGWTVAGVWEIDGAVAASAAPGAPEGVLARTKDRALRGDCDHCGYTRKRNEVIVVTNDSGEELVVGTTCVKDFLGVSPARLLGWLGWERDFEDFREADEGMDHLGGRIKATVSPVIVVAAALAVIRAMGYTPRSKVSEWEMATADHVETYLFGRGEGAKAIREEVGAPTDADTEFAEEAVAWFADEDNVDTDNDYLFSLHLLAAQDRVPVARSMGYLASLPSAYRRETEKRVEKAEAAPIPVNGQRITVTGEVLTLREQESQYGVTLKALVRTEAGWKVWGTMPKALRGKASVGDTIRFDAKVEPSRDDATFGFFNRPTKASFA